MTYDECSYECSRDDFILKQEICSSMGQPQDGPSGQSQKSSTFGMYLTRKKVELMLYPLQGVDSI